MGFPWISHGLSPISKRKQVRDLILIRIQSVIEGPSFYTWGFVQLFVSEAGRIIHELYTPMEGHTCIENVRLLSRKKIACSSSTIYNGRDFFPTSCTMKVPNRDTKIYSVVPTTSF